MIPVSNTVVRNRTSGRRRAIRIARVRTRRLGGIPVAACQCMKQPRVLHLRVMSLGDRHLVNKVFETFPITIGRDPKSDLCIDHGHVSRSHAIIDQRDDRLIITDVGSCNGTRVNGESISPHQPVELRGWHVTFLIGPLWVQGWHEAPPVDVNAERPAKPVFDEETAR